MKWIYGPPATLLEEINWQQPVQHMMVRLQSLSQQAADEFGEELGIVLFEKEGKGIVLTSKGSRYAEKLPAGIYSDEVKPRYNGFIKTGEWYKPWAIPFVSGTIESKLTMQSIDLLPRTLALVERDPWGGPRSWNPVSGDDGSDLVVVRRSLLPPSVEKAILKAAAVVAAAASIGIPALFAFTPALAPWAGWSVLAAVLIAAGLGLMLRRT